MADVKLTTATLNDGTLIQDIDAAIEEARASLEDYEELQGPRTITVKIKMAPDKGNARIIHTEHAVETKFPRPGRSGIAFKADGQLKTDTTIREGDGRQRDLERTADELASLREKKAGN